MLFGLLLLLQCSTVICGNACTKSGIGLVVVVVWSGFVLVVVPGIKLNRVTAVDSGRSTSGGLSELIQVSGCRSIIVQPAVRQPEEAVCQSRLVLQVVQIRVLLITILISVLLGRRIIINPLQLIVSATTTITIQAVLVQLRRARPSV